VKSLAYRHAVLYAGGQVLSVRVESVRDAATIAHVSESFLRKYAEWPSDARAMVRDEVLATTLPVEPAASS
jgi:hypothetical protein